MADGPEMYHAGMRAWQDRFGTRRLADRLEAVTRREAFDARDRALIEAASFFLLATSDEAGWPDCSWKGGAPGFVKLLDARTLAFPSYDGNGQYRSLGNLSVNPRAGLLFVDFAAPRRLRVNGRAEVTEDPALLSLWHGAEAAVRVEAVHVFPNCPRYVHGFEGGALSPHVPEPGREPPTPEWKTRDAFNDALREGDPAKRR